MADKRVIVAADGDTGIGAACATAFGAIGDRVAIPYHGKRERAEQVAGQVRAADGEALPTRCDVGDEASAAAAIEPGMIPTPMNQEAVDDPGAHERAVAHIPMKRAGTPDEACYITGARIVIDGGLPLRQAFGA